MVENNEIDKIELFNKMIRLSHSKQFIFGESKKKKSEKGRGTYKIYRDLSIEIPFDFEAKVMDSFLTEVCFQQNIFGNISPQ